MAEIVDVVDEQDRVLRQASRAEMRRDNLLHRVVFIIVRDSGGRVFVHQRTRTKDVYPGYWDVTVGGVVEAGEDYLAAARRELREEIGITPERLDPLGPVRYEDAYARLLGFAFTTVHDGAVILQEEEIVTGYFVPLAETRRLMANERCCPDGALVFRTYVDD